MRPRISDDGDAGLPHASRLSEAGYLDGGYLGAPTVQQGTALATPVTRLLDVFQGAIQVSSLLLVLFAFLVVKNKTTLHLILLSHDSPTLRFVAVWPGHCSTNGCPHAKCRGQCRARDRVPENPSTSFHVL